MNVSTKYIRYDLNAYALSGITRIRQGVAMATPNFSKVSINICIWLQNLVIKHICPSGKNVVLACIYFIQFYSMSPQYIFSSLGHYTL